MKLLLTLLVALTLSGCMPSKRQAYYAASCQQEGMRQGTDAYEGCISAKSRQHSNVMYLLH